jgi:hypothetical protein
MMIHISDYWLTFAIATVLPALVALVTKKLASSGLKAIVLAVLSAVSGILTSVAANGGDFDWKKALTSFIVSFVTASATHYGLLKPVGISGTNGVVANAVPGGIGTEVPKPDPTPSVEL